jgi:hypothetical protein
MSFFKLGMGSVQEVLTLALMIVFIFAVLYSNIEFTYKIGIGALVFSIIFLTGLASQALKRQQEEDKKRS